MIGAFAMLAGVLAALCAPRPPTLAWVLAIALGMFAGALTPLRRAPGFAAIACLAAGFLLALGATVRWSSLCMPPAAAAARVLVEGRIVGVPARRGVDVRFDAEVVVLEGPGARDARPRRARLAWRAPATVPRSGERWRLVVRLESPGETRNFAGLDSGRVAFRDRIHLVGRVLPATLDTRIALANVSVDGARARIAARIANDVADPDAAALITALAVGLADRLSLDQWRVFNATGTTHLVAISGLHVTLFALAAFFCARRLWRWLPGTRRIGRESFALAAGCAAAGAYALLAGFSVPAQRTWLMLGVFALARLQARHAGAGRIWSLALIAVLLLDPCAPLAAGFWLSFVAVGVILATETSTLAPHAARGSALRVQLVVMLALAPLTIAVFDSVSPAGFLVNLVAIPVVSLVLVPLVLAGAVATLVVPQWTPWLFGAAAHLYDVLWPALVWAADTPVALARATPGAWWCVLAVPAGVLAALRVPWPLRLCGLAFALPLLFPAARMPEAGTARITLLDAGRGQAALIVTHEHVLLFDTGDGWSTAGARVRQAVLPALDALGRKSVDLLVLPRLDPERARGAALLAEERGLVRLVVADGWPASRLPATPCADAAFHWDGIDFALLAGNGRACVLRVSAAGHAILFGGDLDAAGERALVARMLPGSLASEVVIMSHHASALASSREWIEASRARLAIAAGGIATADSRRRAIERWQRAGAAILDVRRDGAIALDLGTNGVVVRRVARPDGYPFAWRRLP